jgi:hypothetical protein
VLVPLDDYFIHQTTDSVAQPGGGAKTFQERNYFNVHSTDGQVLLVCGMGTAPNAGTANAYVISSTLGDDGGQIYWRGARPLDNNRARLDVGEFAYEIVEPMKQWRITMGPNDSGLELDLTWTARHQPWEFDRISADKPDGEVIHDFAHLHQSGLYTGSMVIDDHRYDVDGWYGVRDRTWGIREGLDFWIWSHVHFPDRSLSLYHFEDSAGNVQYSSGGFTDADSAGPAVRITEHDFELAPEERVPTAGTVRLATADGPEQMLEFKALGPLVNYLPPKLVDRGQRTSATGHQTNGWDRWPNAEYDPATVRKAGLVHDSLCEFRLGDEVGYGVFELITMHYEPYGWASPYQAGRG